MTLLVRNSEELLRKNVEFHRQQGVDFFIITDNGSVDGTRDIIDEYVKSGIAERIWEPDDTYSQWRWVTRMARLAAISHSADWVVNNDDDEFWSGCHRTLREELANVPLGWDAVEVRRYNHPPVAVVEHAPCIEIMIYRERESRNALGHPLPSKVCHRAFPDIEVDQGNHSARRAGTLIHALQVETLSISHFPVRGFAAFERKIALGGAAYARNRELGPEVGQTWRWLYELWKQGHLRQWYDRQLLSLEEIGHKLAEGTLSVDDSVQRSIHWVSEESCSPAA